MKILKRDVLTQPIIGVEDDRVGEFQAAGWSLADEAEIARYRKETPFTGGLQYPAPLVLPDDSPPAANNAPEFPR